jgi:predicted transglutaminase-like cysteine proteinase
VHKGILKSFRSRLGRNRLGEVLVLGGSITPNQLRYALACQQSTRAPLGRVLLQEQMIRRDRLYRALVEQWAFRILLTAMTLTLSFSVFGTKSARAASIPDVPAEISLVNVANAAFAPLDHYPALFGSDERESTNLKPFTKWTGMFDRFEASLKTSVGQTAIRRLQRDLASMKGLPLSAMAARVDALINQTPYIEDSRKWGQSDYWATPVEFFERGGDCEDFAITKYTALRALGVPEDRLRVVIVHDMQKNVPHAILVVYADEGAMILDNQSQQTHYASEVRKYRPIFSINRNGWWLHTKPRDTVIASAQ